LLRDAASFFVSIGQQNPDINSDMEINAKTFRGIAALVEKDPNGECLYVDPVRAEDPG
jgi:hypothetical protein